jgi:hypothetical protein
MLRSHEYPCRFDHESHSYRDQHGRRHLSVTQILQAAGVIDFSMVDPATLAAAAERGRRVHELTALWDQWRQTKNDMMSFLDRYEVSDELVGYLVQYDVFLTRYGFHPIPEETERPRLVSISGVLVGMTPDRVGYWPHRPRQRVVIDLKTGIQVLSHPLQLAAYAMALERSLVLAQQVDRIALYLTPDSHRMQQFSNPNDFHAFLDILHGGGNYLEAWKQSRTITQQGRLTA